MPLFPVAPYQPLDQPLNLSPLSNALAGYQKGSEAAYEGETARQLGSLFAAGKPKEAANLAFTRGDSELGMRVAMFQDSQEKNAREDLKAKAAMMATDFMRSALLPAAHALARVAAMIPKSILQHRSAATSRVRHRSVRWTTDSRPHLPA